MLVAACLLRPLPRASRYERFWRWSDLVLMLIQVCVFAFAVGAIWQERLAHMAAHWSSEPLKKFALEITSPTARICWIVAAGVLAFLLQRRRAWFAVAVAMLLGVCMICGDRENIIYSARSFFGVLHVEAGHYEGDGDARQAHADARFDHARRTEPRSRRRPRSLDLLPSQRTGGRRVRGPGTREAFLHHGHIGVVGLGTGTIAAYAQAGQSLTYFEIDAAVRQISQDPKYFTYLTNCKVEPKIRMGDARLTLAHEPDGQFDLLVIDAFSSDAIPVHLLTYEAIEMYFRKLAPGGLLMVHLSNRHLRLGPVVAGTAAELGVVARVRDDEDETHAGKTTSDVGRPGAKTPEDLGGLKDNKDWDPLKPKPGVPLWTDDYSSIVSVMNWDWLPKWMRRANAAE